MGKYNYIVTRKMLNETTGQVFTKTEKTNSKAKAEQMKKDFTCLNNKIKVLEYHLS